MAALENECRISSISGATLEKAVKELGEVPGRRAEVIGELRTRIEAEQGSAERAHDGLVFERKDDKFLLRFLRARKFNIDKSLQLYINYYKYRQKHADLLVDFQPSSVEHVFRSRLFGVLDERLQNGSKAFCMYPARWNTEELPPNDCYKAAMIILEEMIDDEETQVHGISIIDNMKDMPFHVVTSFIRSAAIQKSALVDLQDSFPVRFKGIHFLNEPWYLHIVLKLIKPFLKEKHRERFVAHGYEVSGLHEYIDPQKLPGDFGGFLPETREDHLHTLFSISSQV